MCFVSRIFAFSRLEEAIQWVIYRKCTPHPEKGVGRDAGGRPPVNDFKKPAGSVVILAR
jgi:hypothetical protein